MNPDNRVDLKVLVLTQPAGNFGASRAVLRCEPALRDAKNRAGWKTRSHPVDA